MAAPYVKVKEESLECAICMEKYQRPKALPCVHSFCEKCLEGIPEANPRMIKCPVCRNDWVLPVQGIKALPDNFLLISLLDEAVVVDDDDDDDDGSRSEERATYIKLQCTCCETGQAAAQCLDCYKLLCTICKDVHCRQAETSNHTIATVVDVMAGNVQPKVVKETKQMECADHQYQVADYYCSPCGKRVCVKCIESAHPAPKHHVILESEAKMYCQESIRVLMQKAVKVADNASNVVDQIETSQKDMNNKIEIVKLRVNNEAQAIAAKVEEEKFSILGDIRRMQKEKNDKCTELKTHLGTVENQARQTHESARKAVEEKTGDELLKLYPTLLRNLQRLKEETVEIKPSYTRPPVYVATAPNYTGRLLGTFQETTLVQLDKCYEVRTVTIPGRLVADERKFTFAYGIAVCADGDLVVTDRDKATVYRLSSNGQFKIMLNSVQHNKAGDFRKPRDVAVASSKEIFVVDHSEYVKVYDSRGKYVRRFTTLEPEETPNPKPMLRCVRISRNDGQEIAIIADFSRRQITTHALNGTLLKRLHLTLTPSYMAINATNQILVADYRNSRLELTNMNGEVKFSIDTKVNGMIMRASGVCWGLDNDFYLALHPEFLVYNDYGGTCSIHQFSSEDGTYLSCMARGLNNPVHMVFARDGKLVVANRVSINWCILRRK